ncbi:MAG: hypothetical protein IKS32_11515 [Solobacterium sp.]|nr:hypothetical protein [Solobacterium sp.]
MLKKEFKLTDEALKVINGGVLTADAHDFLIIELFIDKIGKGLSKEQFKQEFAARYHANYHDYSTDGSEEDLQQLMRMIDENWDLIQPEYDPYGNPMK